MAAREIRSPWSTTDTVAEKRDRGDFSVYPVPSDQPVPEEVNTGKDSPARESVVNLDSPTTSADTLAKNAAAEKERLYQQPPLTVMPPL